MVVDLTQPYSVSTSFVYTVVVLLFSSAGFAFYKQIQNILSSTFTIYKYKVAIFFNKTHTVLNSVIY